MTAMTPDKPEARETERHAFEAPASDNGGLLLCRHYTGGDPDEPWAYCGEPASAPCHEVREKSE